MNTHPYLRAYMAGITFPTFMLLFALTIFVLARFVYNVSIPVERIIVFPMAIVPNLWGLWNILYVVLPSHRRLPFGLHGLLLAFVQGSIGFAIARLLHFEIPAFALSALPIVFPIVVVAFYLVWKHLVRWLNAFLGIA